MSLCVVGRKIGMTRVFSDDGVSTPVTVLEVLPNKVLEIKTAIKDGYNGLKIAYGSEKKNTHRVSKSLRGQYAKYTSPVMSGITEVTVVADVLDNLDTIAPNGFISLDMFSANQLVDVAACTIGKGFAGAIKRHHFKSNRASHGNSRSHNVPGSIGMAQDPGRVFPGKRMPGHLGDVRITVQNLKLVRVDKDRNLLLIKGGIPGASGGYVEVRHAVKQKLRDN